MIVNEQSDKRLGGLIEGKNFPLNLADEFGRVASMRPEAPAVILATGRRFKHNRRYRTLTFGRCQELCEQYARGLSDYGIQRGDSVLLLMKPMLDLFPVVFALWKIGALLVTVDPGADREQKMKCIEEIEPKGFIGIPIAHTLRFLFPNTFRSVTHPVTAGHGWFWPGPTLKSFLRDEQMLPLESAPTMAYDEAGIVFTSGSTGPPKGVVNTHGNCASVVQIMKEALQLGSHDISLACHPMFALYFVGLGATTVIPNIDPRFPAKADPKGILEVIHDQKPKLSFIPLSTLNNLCRYCANNNERIPYLKKIITTGAPISVDLIRGLNKAFAEPDADVYAMYGATEALSICYAAGRDILRNAATRMLDGKGTYLGRPATGIKVQVIGFAEQPIEHWRDNLALPPGQIGEICVSGPVVTPEYKNRPEDTRKAKIKDTVGLWHRMGDAGYFDDDRCLWYCGRIADRVETENGTLYPDLVEPIFNRHTRVFRSALVGVSRVNSTHKRAVIIIEPDLKDTPLDRNKLYQELKALAYSHENSGGIDDILIYNGNFPLDVRHNAKIRRDLLADYAAREMNRKREGEHFIQFRCHNIYYYENGVGESLLFLHNAGSDHRIWDFQLEYFSRKNHVIALDSLGYGKSDSPKINYTLSMYTEMVARTVEQLSLSPVTIIGNCTGASMALNYALEHPEKVKRLILFNIATEKTILGGNIEFNCRMLTGRPRLTKLLTPCVELIMLPMFITKLKFIKVLS